MPFFALPCLTFAVTFQLPAVFAHHLGPKRLSPISCLFTSELPIWSHSVFHLTCKVNTLLICSHTLPLLVTVFLFFHLSHFPALNCSSDSQIFLIVLVLAFVFSLICPDTVLLSEYLSKACGKFATGQRQAAW